MFISAICTKFDSPFSVRAFESDPSGALQALQYDHFVVHADYVDVMVRERVVLSSVEVWIR